jgi:hypothetical protein
MALDVLVEKVERDALPHLGRRFYSGLAKYGEEGFARALDVAYCGQMEGE